MNLLDHLKAKATSSYGDEIRLEGFGVACFRRAVATPDGLAFEPGEYGLVEAGSGDDARAFSFRTGKFAMVRPGSFEMLPADTPVPADVAGSGTFPAGTRADEEPPENGGPHP